MNNRRISLALTFTALGVVLVSTFWKNTIFLLVLLVITAYIKHKIIPIKKEIQWFVITGIIGALGESLIMTSGPWSYTHPNLINFPVWLLFLWGYAGTVGVSLYQGLTNNKS